MYYFFTEAFYADGIAASRLLTPIHIKMVDLNMLELPVDIPRKLNIKESDFRLIIGSSGIDYDHNKNEINISNHGYSFNEAIDIFEKMLLPISPMPPVIVKDSIDVNGELRSNIITIDKQGKVIFIALTMRQNETIRIISMRRASAKEHRLFTELVNYNQGNPADS